MTFHNWIQRRENGLKLVGDEDFILKMIYKSFKPYRYWTSDEEFGAVFNLEFSPDGNVVVAACEKKSILLFDPITTKRTKAIGNAHTDNVNCVKFLDNRMFATCSDDMTVALWDTRNLKNKIRSLQGHSNWVKNIEYSQKDGLLVTSGFDGSIYTWDINSYTEQGFIYQKVFHTSGLMRCRLTPDASKLVICTTGGYLIIIHDLDLTTLAKDLCGFKPNIYRLMQLGRQFIPHAAKFDHIFSKSQKRNRVELISDFPKNNDAEVVCALQIHPKGWCCLSRNISYDEGTEWSCIHDIQDRNIEEKYILKDNDSCSKKRKHSDSDDDFDIGDLETPGSSNSNFDNIASPLASGSGSSSNLRQNSQNVSLNSNTNNIPDIWAAEVTVHDRACRTSRGARNTSANAYAYVYAISSGVIPVNNRSSDTGVNPLNEFESTNEPWSPGTVPSVWLGNGIQTLGNGIQTFGGDKKIYKNHQRLMYYIEEPNKGKGFIKEPAFSSDGRIICSPYGTGVRLLAFNDNCSELSATGSFWQRPPPQLLKDINQIKCHSSIVVSTKFSPKYPLLVTGCLAGKISWHQSDF